MDLLELISESDVIIENQRGITLWGYPFFSAKLLLRRLDPCNFQIMNREKGTLIDVRENHRPVKEIFPLERPEEVGKWFIDMRVGDVDDQGWTYSWNFSHGRWRAEKGFVRRRVWVRHNMEETFHVQHIPVKKYEGHSIAKQQALNDENESLVAVLRKQQLDRYKFEIIERCDKSIFQNQELCRDVGNCFQYASSKHRFQEWLKQK